MVGRRAMNFSFSGSEDQFGHERYYRLDQEAQGEQVKVRSQSKKINKAWLNDHVNDPYVKLALKEGFRSRAAYKLKEMDETLGLFKPGMAVVDLGCTPGAWSQYLRKQLVSADASPPLLLGLDTVNWSSCSKITFGRSSPSNPKPAGINQLKLFWWAWDLSGLISWIRMIKLIKRNSFPACFRRQAAPQR